VAIKGNKKPYNPAGDNITCLVKEFRHLSVYIYWKTSESEIRRPQPIKPYPTKCDIVMLYLNVTFTSIG